MNAQDQVLAYIRKHSNEWHPSAMLQRMIWKNRRGTTASPRSIVRRLEELENERLIAVGYEGVNAKYRFIPPRYRENYKRSNERAHKYSNDYWRKPFPTLSLPSRQLQLEALV